MPIEKDRIRPMVEPGLKTRLPYHHLETRRGFLGTVIATTITADTAHANAISQSSITKDTVDNTVVEARGFILSTDYPNVQAAIDAVAAKGGGEVYIPGNTINEIDKPLLMRAGVNLIGMGESSILLAKNCDAIHYIFFQGSGNNRISNLLIQGADTTTHTAIKQIATMDDADELYGVTISNVLIRNFNVGIHFRTVRNLNLDNNWAQDVNSGLELVGKCLVVNFSGLNRFVKGAGNGFGKSRGIYCDWFNYTSGTGLVRPESVKMPAGVSVFGFDTGLSINAAIYCIINNTDVQALIDGVVFSEVETLIIDGNYIQIAGPIGSVGIRGKDQSSVIGAKISIRKNNINATETSADASIGLLLGHPSSAGNVDNVDVEGNDFNGFTLCDINTNGSGNIILRANRCRSTAPGKSILIGTLPANRPIHIHENVCENRIAYAQVALETGNIQLGTNVVGGGTLAFGPSGEPVSVSVSSNHFSGSGSLVWNVEEKNVEVFKYILRGKIMTVFIKIVDSKLEGISDDQLLIRIPAGRKAVLSPPSSVGRAQQGSPSEDVDAYFEISSAETHIVVSRKNSSWAVGNISIFGQYEFEVE